MKNYKRTITTMLSAITLLLAFFMVGCAEQPEGEGSTSSGVDASAESDGLGVYVKPAREDVGSISLSGDGFTKLCENTDGSVLQADEWIFTGDEIAQLSKEENKAILFTVRAWDAEDTLLGEGAFLYDVAQERLYVTISEDGVTCSTSDAPDAAADVLPVLTLPILDEIDHTATVGTAGSSLMAVQAAVKLLEWSENTDLSPDEISAATSAWLAAKKDEQTDCLQKLEMVDDAYQSLLGDDAWDLMDAAGCADVEITWGNEPVEPVEAIMQAAGLR